MTEKLVSGFGEGEEIETQTESELLLAYLKNNWPTETPYLVNLPINSNIDFGTSPDRTNKSVTLNVYRIFSNVIDKDIGSYTYMFDVPVAIDVFVRDITAQAQRREPTALVAIEMFLRDFIANNRLGMRDKGINNMRLIGSEYIEEPIDDGNDTVWYHLVVTVRIYYHMHKQV